MKKTQKYYVSWHNSIFLKILNTTRISVFLVLLAAFTISAGEPFEEIEPGVATSTTTGFPQSDNVVIKGTVKDNTGFPLPGVSVRIKGTTTGAATDIDGNFEFRVPNQKNMILLFSFIGMKEQEIAYKGQTFFDVTMQDESVALEDVIVTGYQKIDRRLFTGSADVVKADELKTDGANDVSRMLQGKSAGVQVQNVSGTFGAAPKMRVRGASSIHGDQKPLWVVDGIVQEDVVDVSADDLASGDAATLISSSVAGLNSDDIESFQILKDASATALYGARAMNGVVVITTKRGQSGSMRVNYSGEFSLRLKPSYNSYNLMNSQEQMRAYLDLEEKGWLNYTDVMRGANGGVYYKMYTALDNYIPGQGFEIENTKEGRHNYLKRFEKVNTDWFDALFKNSVQHSHSVSITAGSQKSRFFASLSYFGDPGWTIGDKVDRYTANMNASFDINKYITFHLLTNNSFRKQKAPGAIGQATDAITGVVSREFDINPFSYALNTSRAMRINDENGNPEYYVRNYAPFNIFNELENNHLDLDMLDTKFQAELEIKPMTGWDIKLLGAVRYVKSTREHNITENSNQAEAYRAAYDATMRDNNKYLYADPDYPGMPKEIVLPRGGFYKRTDNRLLNYYFRAMTNYMKGINDIHLFNIAAGMEVKNTERRETFQSGFGIQYDRGNVPFIDYRIIKQLLERGEDFYGMSNAYERFAAFFFTGSYSYNERYTLSLTGRYDGSNRMGESLRSRWLPTWNVSGAWHLHNEEFFQPLKSVVSNMSIRSTYGLTANMGPATNAKAIFYSNVTFRPSQTDRENEIYIDVLGNSDLTWEKQYEFNVGMDLGLINNKISISADYYIRRGFDLIGELRTMGIGGMGSKQANYANMKSSGVEFSLNTKNITSDKFSWTTNVTFAYSTNEITKLSTSARVVDLTRASGYPLEGYPVRSAYAVPFMGLNDSGLPTYRAANAEGKVTTSVDGVNFQDRTHYAKYMKYMGSMDPKFTGGMDNTFKYGPFRLSAFLTYQFGSKIWLYDYFSSTYSDLTAFPKEFGNRWMVPGDEKYTKIPAFVSKLDVSNATYNYGVAYNSYNKSTERVAKGDFIRLKEVSLSYDVPKNFVNSIHLQSMSFRFSASNIWLIYADKKLKGEDPEFARAGGVSLPVPKQFTLSVKVGF